MLVGADVDHEDATVRTQHRFDGLGVRQQHRRACLTNEEVHAEGCHVHRGQSRPRRKMRGSVKRDGMWRPVLAMPHTREQSALWARAGGAAAHLQSKMRSIASSFQSSGMLIRRRGSSFTLGPQPLGVLMCPASMPTPARTCCSTCWAISHCAPCIPTAHTEDLRLWGHRTPAGGGAVEDAAIASSAGWRDASRQKIFPEGGDAVVAPYLGGILDWSMARSWRYRLPTTAARSDGAMAPAPERGPMKKLDATDRGRDRGRVPHTKLQR